MVLNSWPTGLNISGNLPAFIASASSSETITVTLKRGTEVIIEEKYDPDANGKLKVDYRKIIDNLLLIEVPPFLPGVFVQTKGVGSFSATFVSSNGIDQQIINFTVVKGGVEGIVDQQLFLENNFLTWQPQVKEIKYHDPEFLTYYSAINSEVKLKAFFANGDQTITFANLNSNELNTVNVNYGNVASSFTDVVLYFDVWIEAPGGIRLTSIQRYVLTNKVYENESLIVFENSVGGIDVIRLTGQIEEKNTSSISNALFDEYVVEFDSLPERAFTINSGYLKNNRETQWAVDLINSLQKYLILDGNLTPVYSDKPEISAVKGELASFEITLLCSKKTRYLNLTRQTNALQNLTISTNTGQVFFLAPRLNDLQWANGNDVLVPVQFPYENFFRKISLASIINGAGGGIANELDPTVPLHVKSITQAQIIKWDSAAISSDFYTKTEIAAILNGAPSLAGYNKANWDAAFSWGNHAGLYQPLENQRLSKSDSVAFVGADIASVLSIPTAAPTAPVPGKVYLYASGVAGGGGTPPTAGYFIGLQDVDPSALADQYVPYYDAASGKFKFRANNFGSISWTSISGRPTKLSDLSNDLGNYGNWITAAQGAALFHPLENQRLSTGDEVSFQSMTVNDLYSYVDLRAAGNLLLGGTAQVDVALALYNGVGSRYTTVTAQNVNADIALLLPNAAGTLALVSQIPTNVVQNDGGTYNLNINGNATAWAGNYNTNAPKNPNYFLVNEGSADWGYASLGQVSTALGLNNGSTLNNNISGSALLWNGTPFTAGNISGSPYFITLNSSATNAGYSSLGQVSAALGVNNGSTLNNNISGSATTWAGKTGDLTNLGTSLSYLYGSDYANGNAARAWDASQVKAFLGLPSSGAYDLQWVTNNGGKTTNAIQVTGGNGSGFGKGIIMFYEPSYGSVGAGVVQAHNYITDETLPLILNATGGKVGIGTASPREKLEVNGNIIAGGGNLKVIYDILENYGSPLKINAAGGLPLLLQNNGSSVMAIVSGNVGIGTNTPNYKLDVGGDGYFSSDLRVSGKLYAQRSGADGSSWTTSQVEITGTNPGIGFHFPGIYGAALYMNNNGTLNWGGAGISTGSFMSASDYISGLRIFAGYDSGIAGSINTNDYLRISGNGGVYWPTHGIEFSNTDANGDTIALAASGGAVGFKLKTGGGVTRGYVYADNSNSIGFLTSNGSWGLRVDNTGNAFATNKLSAPTVDATAELIIPRSAPVAPISGKAYLYSI